VAIYHLSVKTISRSVGRSATAAAAYRAGVEIADKRTGEIHDYTRKGGVESAELVLPAGAPKWAADRAAVWNAAEQAETRKNSTVAREFEIALPSELSADERQRLAHDFAREIVERHGCIADVAIHAPGKEGDNRNHHAHILCSTRRLTAEGFTEKTRELDERKSGLVDHWRERFASLQNERLRENGIADRVDHRSLEAQGIDRVPTVHLGPSVVGMERRGVSSNVQQRIDAEVEARLREAQEAGKREREAEQTERSIIDLSTDIVEAKDERDLLRLVEQQKQKDEQAAQARSDARERERLARPVKKTDTAQMLLQELGLEVRAQEVAKPARQKLADLPMDDQIAAFHAIREKLAAERQQRAQRVTGKAEQRFQRRNQAAQEFRKQEPQPPTGLLAGFKQASHLKAMEAWKAGQRYADKLAVQGQSLYQKMANTVRNSKEWSFGKIRQTEPELVKRIEVHREEERERTVEQRKEQDRDRGYER
jgi:ATP-dependent exoDNAse (exonuclease V) alpha subunit